MDVVAILRLPFGGRIALAESGHDEPRIETETGERRRAVKARGVATDSIVGSDHGLKLMRAVRIKISARRDRPVAGAR
jgi:hypothetical protein